MRFCSACGEKLDLEGRVSREEVCPSCGAYLHSCLNCEFHDERAHNQCREPDAEWVTDKQKGNFCEFFRYRESAQASPDMDRKKRAREQLKRLFGED
jgi:hypothetical protein